MLDYRYEVKGDTWFISNHPRVTSGNNFEGASRLYL